MLEPRRVTGRQKPTSCADRATVTIRGLTPQDVNIRILGDIAIIHAPTSYTTADGEQRDGRYTDVRARRDGKWPAVSAQVTR